MTDSTERHTDPGEREVASAAETRSDSTVEQGDRAQNQADASDATDDSNAVPPAPDAADAGEPALSLLGVTKRYETAEGAVTALDDVDLDVDRGEFLTIMGPSGSGKSTMLNLLGLLDDPTEGEVRVGGQLAGDLDRRERTATRKEHLGFVFQDFYLLPTLSARENVAVPTIYGDGDPARERAADLLDRVGLGDRLDHRPNELSGGQQQRVAIARSLINRPRVVLADEPTGNLDRDTGRRVLDELARVTERGVSVVAVTHDPLVTEYSDRRIELVDGAIRR